jgi:hypothetical protein
LYISLNEHNSKHKLNGQRIRVYTDHLNLTNDNFNTEHVMRWHLILQQYSHTLLYIYIYKQRGEEHSLVDHYGLHDNDLSDEIYPLLYKNLYISVNLKEMFKDGQTFNSNKSLLIIN